MNCARLNHSLIVANGKLYAIGGWVKIFSKCITFMFYSEFYSDSTYDIDDFEYVEEYNPNVNKWKVIGEIDFEKLQ